MKQAGYSNQMKEWGRKLSGQVLCASFSSHLSAPGALCKFSAQFSAQVCLITQVLDASFSARVVDARFLGELSAHASPCKGSVLVCTRSLSNCLSASFFALFSIMQRAVLLTLNKEASAFEP